MMCPKCEEVRLTVIDTIRNNQKVNWDRRASLKLWASQMMGPYRDHLWVARRRKCRQCGLKYRTVELPAKLVLELVTNSIQPEEKRTRIKIEKPRSYLK